MLAFAPLFDGSALAAPPAAAIDGTRDGVYQSGRWEYRYTITAPGSKSEGARGVLLYDGKPVEEPIGRAGDYYATPWGDIQWMGHPDVLWGEHGWAPREPGTLGGAMLVDPWLSAGRPVVMAMVLSPGGVGEVEPWVKAELGRLGVASFHVDRGWFPLTDQAIPLSETTRGRLAQPRSEDTLTVLLDGTPSFDLPRRDGATAVTKLEADAWLALRVDRAARAFPAPLDLGPSVDGKVVTVSNIHEVVITLPRDPTGARGWTVTSVVGDSPRGASVSPLGPLQRVAGTEEALFRVTDLGTSVVTLGFGPPNGHPEKTFRVTLVVDDLWRWTTPK